MTVWTWAVVPEAHQPPALGPTRPGSEQTTVSPATGHRPPATRHLPVAGDFRIEVTLRADPLTAVMLVTVTLVSLLVAVYSVGYMHGDPGYWRFFTYIGLFVFSMTMLVSVSNFVLLYVFWEAVGLVQLSADRLLVPEAGGGRGGQEGVSGEPRGRLRLRPGRVPDLDDLRHAGLPRHGRRVRPACWARGGTRAWAAARRSACSCSWGPAARAPSSRCTSGCPTPWKAPRRSVP